MMFVMRMFVAIEPSVDAVEHLDEFLAVRREAGPEVRWSSPARWHLTLAFMGAAPDRAIEDVVDGVGVVAQRTAPVGLAVSGGGCFPDATRAKVLWAAVAGAGGPDDAGELLGRLARGVRSACAVAGAAPEGGAFVPHLTLGRFSWPQDATRWLRVLATYAGPAWVASEVDVVASHLPRERGRGPRHEVLARLPLGG
jgi:RNA 2',3'-cyclic 3'-phosphodiesterase